MPRWLLTCIFYGRQPLVLLVLLLAGCVRPASQNPLAPSPLAVTGEPHGAGVGVGASQEHETQTAFPLLGSPQTPTPTSVSVQAPAQSPPGAAGSSPPGAAGSSPPGAAGSSPPDTLTTATPPSRPARLVFRLPRAAFPAGLSLNGDYQVFAAALDGSDLAPLTPRLGGDPLPLDVSPTGSVLVAAGANLYAVRLPNGAAGPAPTGAAGPAPTGAADAGAEVGGEPLRMADNYAGPLGEPGRGPETGAYWLANGGQVVYIGMEGGERAVFRVNADGSNRLRLTGPGAKPAALLPADDPAGVTWRPGVLQNGTPVPVCAPTCYRWTSLAGSETREAWPGVQVAALAPGPGALAYHAENRGGWEAVPVFAADPAGVLVGETEPLNVCALAWSPDGRRLLIGQLYGESFCGWYLLWKPGEAVLEELPENLPASYAQRWSPGGRSLLFEDWSGAWMFDLVTQELRPVLSGAGLPPGAATHILWAPPGGE